MSKDLPKRESRKDSMTPLLRLEMAIAKGKEAAFNKALAELCASDDFGNWPHRALRLALDSKRPELRLKFVEAITGSSNPPKPGKPDLFMNIALNSEAFDCIPALHRAGFTLQKIEADLQTIGRHMGTGRWPHPDLILPDALDSLANPVCVKAFWANLAIFGLSAELLALSHISKLVQMKTNEPMCKTFTNLYTRMSKLEPWQLEGNATAAEAGPGLLCLMARGWFRPDLIVQRSRKNAGFGPMMDVMAQAWAEQQRIDLDKKTAAAPTKQAAPERRALRL